MERGLKGPAEAGAGAGVSAETAAGSGPASPRVASGPAPRNTRLEEAFAGVRRDPGLLPGLAEPRELIVSISSMAPNRRQTWRAK